MDTIISILILIALFVIVPVLVGMLFTQYVQRDNGSLTLAFVFGFITMFALFQLISIPFILCYPVFEWVAWLWYGSLLCLSILSMCLNRRKIWEMTKAFIAYVRKIPPVFFVAVALIVAQAILCTVLTHADDDDAFYIATQTTTLQTNTMFRFNAYTGEPYMFLPIRYMTSGYMICCAAIAQVVGIHPTILAHTVFPLLMIPIVYVVFYRIGRELFENDIKKTACFLIVVSILNLFGNFSIYSTSSFLMFRIWQGKALVANLGLPFLFLMLIRTMENNGGKAEWMMLFAGVLAACCFSSMGVILTFLMVGTFAVVYAIRKKNVKILLKAAASASPSIVYGIVYYLL